MQIAVKPGKSSRHFRNSLTLQLALLLIRFTLDFNESLLIAEISQTFYKFMGVTLISSTIIWFIPLIIYVFIAPLYARFVLYDHSRINLSILLSIIVFLFCNTISFSYLHYLETLAANQMRGHSLLMLAGIFAFSMIDLSKMVFDYSLFRFLCQRIGAHERGRFETAELYVSVTAKILGGIVSCLYVLQQKTFSGRFSEYFYTNIQMCYFLAGVANAVTIPIIFACWPKEDTAAGQLSYPSTAGGYLSMSFPGLKTMFRLTKENRLLALRKFFIIGLYFNVILTLTQWVGDLFTMRYSRLFLNNSMQILDIGTSWGSITLTIYYCLNGIQMILIRNFPKELKKFSNFTSRVSVLVGGGCLVLTYLLYEKDIKYVMLLLGLTGFGHDLFLDRFISDELELDPAFSDLRGYEKAKAIEDLDIFIEIMAYTAFVFLFPVLFFAVDDIYWILATGIIYLTLATWHPKLENSEQQLQIPIAN